MLSKVLLDIKVIRSKHDLDRLFKERYEQRKKRVLEFLWDLDFYCQRLPFELRCSEEIRKSIEKFMEVMRYANAKSKSP